MTDRRRERPARPDARLLEIVVEPAQEGDRLDVALAVRPEVGSRAAAQRLIEAGRVAVGGRPRPKRHRLRAGERITAELPGPAVPADTAAGAGVPHRIVHEDDHLLVVEKPAGVVVHPSRGHQRGTLVHALMHAARGGPEPWRPGVVHRLDRDTSGLLVVAKSDPMHRALQELIRERRLRRQYLALVDGRPDALEGTIDASLGRDRRDRTTVSTRTDRPRAARTHFRRLEDLPRTTLLEVELETGRTHQIRAHLAAIGHPVMGDPVYGPAGPARLSLGRQFLHAAVLEFDHPVTGTRVAARSELPDDLRGALEAARLEEASR